MFSKVGPCRLDKWFPVFCIAAFVCSITVLGGLEYSCVLPEGEDSLSPWTCTLTHNLNASNPAGNSQLTIVRRKTGLWLSMELRMPAAASLADINLRLPSCGPLWDLIVQECSFLLSSTWPSHGIEAGPAYLNYQRLVGSNATAERVNITCPPDDWDALLATRGSSSSSADGAPALAPCGTATVTTGQQLLDALERLQPLHARVLVTLAANMSLPTQPTPQRLMAPPDDTQPLVRIYRNVTLAGGARLDDSGSFVREGSSMGGTELDLRMRRNVFDLMGSRPQSAEQEGPSQGRPILTLADMYLVNTPPSPPDTWPVGLLSMGTSFANLNRSGAAGMQMMLLRIRLVASLGETGYIGYWYNRMQSLIQEERTSAAWLRRDGDPLEYVTGADGGRATLGILFRALWGYNTTMTPTSLLTPATMPDFDLWSTDASLPGDSGPTPMLPPSSFAVARGTVQLLALLQESWTDGPRIILLVANVTLRPGEWSQAGAVLSYNVTLAGPVAGAPVWLDTAGMQLLATAPAATTPGAVTLRLQRLRLVGFAPPLLAADPREVAEADAQGAMAGSQELVAWKDRCLQQLDRGFGSTQATAVDYQIQDCVLEVPAATLELLRLFNSAGECASRAANAAGATVPTPTATTICNWLRKRSTGAASTGGPLDALLTRSLAVVGQTSLSAANGSASSPSPPSISFTSATLGGVTLVDTSAVTIAGTAAGGGSEWTDDSACGAQSLLLAAIPLLATEQQPESGGDDGKGVPLGAVIGGAAGGAAAVALCVVVALVVLRRRRRRLHHNQKASVKSPAGGGDEESAAVGIALGGKEGSATGDRTPMVAGNASAGEESLSQGCFSLSYVPQQDDGAAGAPGRPTMADVIRLGQNKAPDASGPRAAEVGGLAAKEPADPRVRRNSQEGPGPDLRTAVAEDIENMMRKCQVAATAAAGSGPRRGRMPLLGRGAHGAVYLGEWRGLPTAVKVIVLGAGESAQRRERLAREVALTSTLNHPNIVPTYHFSIETIRAAGDSYADALQDRDDPRVGNSGDKAGNNDGTDDHHEVAALRLRLLMQYCEGGTLKEGLKAGRFSSLPNGGPAPPPVSLSNEAPAPPPASPSGTGAAVPAPADGGGVGAASIAGSPHGTPQSAQLHQTPDTSLPSAAAPGRLPLEASADPRLACKDVAVAANLPLSLLAALDVLRGLKYLHSCGVIHGDLTENNILLKAVQPALGSCLSPSSSITPAISQHGDAQSSRTATRSLHSDEKGSLPLSRGGVGRGCPGTVGSGGTDGVGRGGTDGVGSGGTVRRVAPDAPCRPAADTGAEQLAAEGKVAGPAGGEEPQQPLQGAGASDHAPAQQLPNPTDDLFELEQDPLLAATMRSGDMGQDQAGPQQPQMQERLVDSLASGTGTGTSTTAPGSFSAAAVMTGMSAPTRLGPAYTSVSRSDLSSSGNVANADGRRFQGWRGPAFNGAGTQGDACTDKADEPLQASGCGGGGASQTSSWLVGSLPSGTTTGVTLAAVAAQLLSWTFKISDFGLSVQLQDPLQSHLSNMSQGTPFFTAPEVVLSGRLSPAADIYSFGVILWLLLHGVSLGQVRHLLPPRLHTPAGPLLLRHASPGLPPAARNLLWRCLAPQPAQRPTAAEARRLVEGLLQEVVAPELSQLLLAVERREHMAAPVTATS